MKQTIYRANYSILHNIIHSVFNDDKFANKILDKEFRVNKKLGARDRRFLAVNAYNIVRWWRKILVSCNLYDTHFQTGEFLTDKNIEYILASWFTINGWVLPEFLSSFAGAGEKSHRRWKRADFDFATKHSLCDFFACKLVELFGDEAAKVAEDLNKQANIYLRYNTSLVEPMQLINELKEEEVEVVPVDDMPSCLRLVERKNLFITKAFKKGYFEVQDKGSQMIAPALDVKPGMKVVDACAGAGGKSLHISDLMNNKGKIVSLDIHAWKLKELKLRARRNKSSIIETRHIDNSKVTKRLKGYADRLLLDVPCTGSGVIKRNPDSKWKFSQEKLDELVVTQNDIIERYSKMVNEKGKMVYATCSVFPEENSGVITTFLKNNKDWQIESEENILPHKFNSDGFYHATLSRK